MIYAFGSRLLKLDPYVEPVRIGDGSMHLVCLQKGFDDFHRRISLVTEDFKKGPDPSEVVAFGNDILSFREGQSKVIGRAR